MSRLPQDVRLAFRGLWRTPAFTISAVLILGIGIGMAVAMWSVFSAVLLRRLPLQDPDRVVMLRVSDRAGVDVALLPADVDQFRHESRTVRAIAGFSHGGAMPTQMMDGDRPLPLSGARVQGQFFDVLGVRPVMGRLLGPGDDSLSHVMVLSYDAWQRYFHSDPAVIGRHFRQVIDEVTYTIVGVAPPGIDFPAGADYWWPVPWYQSENVVARLAPGATPIMARDEFRAFAERLFKERGGGVRLGGADVRTFDAAVVGNVRPILRLMVAAVSLLLLIVCINVGNLLLLRAAARTREIAVRRALGATYTDVVRYLVVESGLLALGGGALGFIVAEVARRALVAAAPAQIPRLDAIRLSGAPAGAAAAMATLSVLLFGVGPALLAVRRDASSPLRIDTRSGTSTRQRRNLRQILVGSQVALAVILLAGAGLLSRSLQRLQSIDLGLKADHLAVLDLTMPFRKYPTESALDALWERLAPPLRAVPGVTAVSPTVIYPLIGPNFFLAVWETDPPTPEDVARGPLIAWDGIGPDYFRALGMPILRGRAFLDTDHEHSQPVAIVSATVARRYWPGQDPIGKRIKMQDTAWDKGFRTVVGVVRDTHWRSLRETTPLIYLPYQQSMWQGSVVLRSASSLAAVLPRLRRAVSEVDPSTVIWDAHTMDDYLAKPLAQPRMSALLLSTFGLVALALAVIGLYAIMASAVREQTRDIGVRMALGATPQRVRGEVLSSATFVSLGGAAVGVIVALGASRLIASLLFEVSPTDPVALAGACGVLLAVATIAAYLPAHRASRVDPARAINA